MKEADYACALGVGSIRLCHFLLSLFPFISAPHRQRRTVMDDPPLKRTKSANVCASLHVGPRSPQLTACTRPSLPQETNEPGVDRFSKLPNELLQRIFALAYAKKKPSQPLSRRLRPFYDEIVFRKIKADSSSRIRSLRKLSTKRPGLGSHLRELVIQEAGQQSCLSLDEIKTVFGCLSNLQTLTLYTEGRGWLEAVLPNNPDVKTVLPSSTVSLTIVASSRQRGDAYRPDRLSSLAQRPGLTELALDFSSNYKNLDVPCATVSDLVLPNIINLSVGLPKVTSSVNAFLDCFPHVRKLTLTSHADAPDFATALASIKSPAEVVELTIRASPKAEWRFPDELAAFSSLNSLVLAGQFQHLESDACEALGHTVLTTLAIGKKERHLGQGSDCAPWGRGPLPYDQDGAPRQCQRGSASPAPGKVQGLAPGPGQGRGAFLDERFHGGRLSRA